MSKTLWWHLNVATCCSTSNIFIIRTVIKLYWSTFHFLLTMDILGQNYTLEGLVRCKSHGFTMAVKSWYTVGIYWWYVSQSKRTPHLKIFYIIILVVVVFFFLLFSIKVGNNNTHRNFAASQTMTQNLDDFPVSTLPRDPPSIENITSVTITKSSTITIYWTYEINFS